MEVQRGFRVNLTGICLAPPGPPSRQHIPLTVCFLAAALKKNGVIFDLDEFANHESRDRGRWKITGANVDERVYFLIF